MSLWKYALLVFLGGCSYGVVSTFIKLAYFEGFTVSDVTGTQYFFGAIILWILSIFIPKDKLNFKQLMILLISGTPMGLTGIFYNQSLKYVDASIAIILLLQFTWIGIVLQYLLDRNVPTRKNMIATILILFGSILASGLLYTSLAFSLIGFGWGLLAACSFASFIYISGRTTIPIHPIRKSAIMTTGAAILVFLLLPPGFLFNGTLFDGLLSFGLFYAFFGSVLPPLLFNIGMPKVGSGLGNILSASELPTAVIMSTLILREHVTLSQWIGVTIILIGITYPNLQKGYSPYNEKMKGG